MTVEISSEASMKKLGARLGMLLAGGEVIELIGDVGSGKTTFAKGIAEGLEVEEDVQSPSFTISRVYEAARGLTLLHYDFYRLEDAGIMQDELSETIHDERSIIVIEWAGIVTDVLPNDRLIIRFSSPSETLRQLEITGTSSKHQVLAKKLV